MYHVYFCNVESLQHRPICFQPNPLQILIVDESKFNKLNILRFVLDRVGNELCKEN